MQPQFLSEEEEFVNLTLADGSTWGIVADDEKAAAICSCFAETMQLQSHQTPTYWLLVSTDGDGSGSDHVPLGCGRPESAALDNVYVANEDAFLCVVSPIRESEGLTTQLLQLSLVIAQQAQTRGGFLLHGALIERDGWGVILAGPGGVGKTTASRRLPSPWLSRCDDATLIVRGIEGMYWAHPWPTWSNFMSGGNGGTWDVNHAVPLKAIFFLKQAQLNRIEPIGTGHSVPLLIELAEQVSWSMAHGQGRDVARALRLQRFENICSLAKSLNFHHLHLSLDGAFWEEIERVINEKEAL